MHIYIQRTGNWYHNGELFFQAYAGHGEGLNNPAMQNVPSTGPLPVGSYTICTPLDSDHVGKYAMPLQPAAGNNMHGRSAFYLHGDNPLMNRSASNGCIVKSPRIARQKVWESGDHVLHVVAEESDLAQYITKPITV